MAALFDLYFLTLVPEFKKISFTGPKVKTFIIINYKSSNNRPISFLTRLHNICSPCFYSLSPDKLTFETTLFAYTTLLTCQSTLNPFDNPFNNLHCISFSLLSSTLSTHEPKTVLLEHLARKLWCKELGHKKHDVMYTEAIIIFIRLILFLAQQNSFKR